MEIIKHFEIYIADQKATGMHFTIFGVLLLLAAFLLHFSQLNPITQGLSNGFFVISILLLGSGIGFIMSQNKLLKTKTETYQSDQKATPANAMEIYILRAVLFPIPCLIIS